MRRGWAGILGVGSIQKRLGIWESPRGGCSRAGGSPLPGKQEPPSPWGCPGSPPSWSSNFPRKVWTLLNGNSAPPQQNSHFLAAASLMSAVNPGEISPVPPSLPWAFRMESWAPKEPQPFQGGTKRSQLSLNQTLRFSRGRIFNPGQKEALKQR